MMRRATTKVTAGIVVAEREAEFLVVQGGQRAEDEPSHCRHHREATPPGRYNHLLIL